MKYNSPKVTWHDIQKKEQKTAKPSFRIHTRSYPGRLAYIHAHPFMIVGIDTIASEDGGQRGTGGGGGIDIVQGRLGLRRIQ